VTLRNELERRAAGAGEEVRELLTWPQRLAVWLIAEVRWLFRVMLSSGDRFYWDNGFSKAASLAYTTLLSLVPVTALGFGLLASFAVSSEALPEVRRFIFRQFVPSTEAVDSVLQYLSEYSAVISSLNLLVVAFLVITTVLLINSVEYALNEVWQVYEPRSLTARIGVYSSIIVLAPVLALSAYYTTKFRVEPFLADFGIGWYLNFAYTNLLPFLIDFGAFASLYYMVPKAPVRFRSATFGAFIGALLFAFAKTAFVIYVERFSSYYTIYQTLAAIPIFLFWLYCAWVIVLFGAEVSYQAQHLPRTGKLWKRSVLSVGDARLVLAAQSLVIIARSFSEGRKLPNDLELAEALGCSTVVLKPALDALERAGMVLRGGSRDMPVTLIRSPEAITLAELREALFSSRVSVLYPAEMTRLFGAFADTTREPAKVTLADIVFADTSAREKA